MNWDRYDLMHRRELLKELRLRGVKTSTNRIQQHLRTLLRDSDKQIKSNSIIECPNQESLILRKD